MNIDISTYPITTCGIYITRRCNLRCKHCSACVVNTKRHEMLVEDWQKAFNILKSLEIDKVSILGGEPTIYRGLSELVRYNSKVTNLDLAIVSNSISNDKIYIDLARSGLKRFSTSIDVTGEVGFDSDSTTKSHRAWHVLELMKQQGIKHLTGYSVLRPENMEQIENILTLLSDQGIWLYIIPFHSGTGDFWQTRSRNLPRAFTAADRSLLEDFSGRMIAKKQTGALLANTIEYLTVLPDFAINLAWHCAPVISELRIDADGVLMSCNDIKGRYLSQYSIFDLGNSDNLTKVLEARALDTKDCPGCFWPSHYHAQQLRYKQSSECWIWPDSTSAVSSK